MPNNHSKFRIPRNTAVSGVPRSTAVSGAPGSLHRDHRGAGVHAPGSLVGEALDFQRAAIEKASHRSGGLGRRNAGKDHPPLGRLQRKGAQRGRVLANLDHVNPVWQGRVEPFRHLGHGTGSRERKLQILSLTRGPGRGRTSVRDFRVRRES